MRLIQQPSRWSCLATSWAMVLGCSLENLFSAIGHDGSEILYPDRKDPERRRSFHPSEFLMPALVLGYAVVQVELNPYWETPSGEVEKVNHLGGNEVFVRSWMKRFDGVITGQTPKGLWHAVAWSKEEALILDPAYTYRKMDYMEIHTFWAAVPRSIV